LIVAIVGWRTWQAPTNRLSMGLWCAQMALNFLWSPVFFTAQRPLVALALILMLLFSIVVFIAREWSIDRTSGALFIPYAAWMAFASILNFEIVRLN
jgi:benzodiazapine receptor